MESGDELIAAIHAAFRDHPSYGREFSDALSSKGLPLNPLIPSGAYSARGAMGQFLVISPGQGLVGVRMRAEKPIDGSEHVDEFDDFPDYVLRLVP